MRESITTVTKTSEEVKEGGSKSYAIAIEARDGLEELKGEFEYMKTRFSPQFVQRVDKALSNLTTLAYDIEVVKMTTAHAAMKKDLDMVEQRLQQYVLMPKFLELQHTCMDLAHKKEIVRLDDEIEKTRNMLVKFALKTDVNEKFRKVEQELWEEIALKQEKTVFDRKIEHFENEAEIEKKSVNKQLSSIREVTDRMRRKVEETSHAMIEIKSETDTKLSAKEG